MNHENQQQLAQQNYSQINMISHKGCNSSSSGLGGTMIKPLANGSTSCSAASILNETSELKDAQKKPNFITAISGDVLLKGQLRSDNRYSQSGGGGVQDLSNNQAASQSVRPLVVPPTENTTTFSLRSDENNMGVNSGFINSNVGVRHQKHATATIQ